MSSSRTCYTQCSDVRVHCPGVGTENWQPGVTQLPVPALEAGAQYYMTLHMLCARPGIVTIEARLGTDAPHAAQHSPSRAADAAPMVTSKHKFPHICPIYWLSEPPATCHSCCKTPSRHSLSTRTDSHVGAESERASHLKASVVKALPE